MYKQIYVGLLLFTFASCEIDSKNTEENTLSEQSTSFHQIKNEQKMQKPSLQNYVGYPIVFYNVENLFDIYNDPSTKDDDFTPEGYKEWDEVRYLDKLDKLSEAIGLADDKNPIFIGLAEVENIKTLRDLSTTGRLKNTNYNIAHFESADMRGIDCGLLYDQDRFKLKEKKKFRIDFDWNRDITTRDILYVYGDLMNEKDLHIFVNHWSSRREGKEETEKKRTTAAKVLRVEIDKILSKDANANILIMGDFNDHPTDKAVYEVLAAKSAKEAKDDNLINLLWEEHANGEGTHNYRREWDVLDQMIVSQGLFKNKNGLGIEKNNAFILRDDRLIFTYPDGGQKPSATYGGPKYYGGYSDHLPVYLKLK
ncbi:MAG: endonuclease [Lishizhenia sp.]